MILVLYINTNLHALIACRGVGFEEFLHHTLIMFALRQLGGYIGYYNVGWIRVGSVGLDWVRHGVLNKVGCTGAA